MEHYIALLRGVNVGGKNKVPMKALKAALEEAGLLSVSTYINSGNIFFSSEDTDCIALQQLCHKVMMDTFQLDIPVAVLSVKTLADALSKAPEWWGREDTAKHNAIFVIAPATVQSIIQEVGEAKPEYERIAHVGPVIFWSAPLETFSRTRWSKVVSTSAYGSITIRNANTTRKLLQLSQ